MLVPVLVAAGIGLVVGVVLHHRFRPTHHRRGDRGGFFLLAILLAGVAGAGWVFDVTALTLGATACAAASLVLATHPPTNRHVHLPHRSHGGGRHTPGHP
jgi:hypothetical protein